MTLTGRIVVAREFGTPDVLTIEEHPSPALPTRTVRVAVRAAGLNPVDARRRAGGFGGQPPLVFGSEFAGIVVESAHPSWHRGDEVIGWSAQGAAADLLIADGDRIIRRPNDIDWLLAGGLSGVGNTALTALSELSLPSGSLAVVHGASGGVGTALVQLAVARGIDVIGTTSKANADYVHSLGATPVLYGPGLADRISDAVGDRRIDASIDLAGTREAGDLGVAVLRAGGRAITLVPETMQSHGLPLVRTRPSAEGILELSQALRSGVLTLPVEAVLLAEVTEAHRRLDAKHARGKLVLDLSDNPHFSAFTTGE